VHAALFSHGVDSGEHADDADREQRDDEDKERVVVVDSDAVVDPGTMMIVAINAAPAYRAVFAAGRHEHFAVGTKLAGMYFLEEVNEFVFRLKIAGVAQGGKCKTDDKDGTQNKEGDQEVALFLI
jgi:hypothetical protein